MSWCVVTAVDSLLQCRVSLTGLSERRVKCPEQRPICSHCRRLGLACGYALRLTWQEPTFVPQALCRTWNHAERDGPTVYDWMFVNVAFQDFDDIASGQYKNLVGLSPALAQDVQRTEDLFCQSPGLLGPSLRPTGLSNMTISNKEARLWDYFVNFITPQCAVRLTANPYRSVVLRIAAATPGGPLFQCVMAIAASQMHTLGHGELEISPCNFRGLAFRSLRRHLDASQHGPEEAIVTVVMMSFLEVSNLQECEKHTTTNRKKDTRELLTFVDHTR